MPLAPHETLCFVYQHNAFKCVRSPDDLPTIDDSDIMIFRVSSTDTQRMTWWVEANQTSDYAKDAVRFALALADRMEANPEEDWNKAYKAVEKKHGGLSYFQANEIWKALTELWIGRDRIAGMRLKN